MIQLIYFVILFLFYYFS